MRVGTLEVDFQIPGSASLKAKRKVMASLRDRIRARFPVAVAEVAHQDLHARGVIGVAAVGGNGGLVDRALDEIVRGLQADPRILILDIVRESY
jgi:uncharacterized protein YlxP (DUF503 family)